MRSKLSVEILITIVVALLISVMLSLGFNYYGESYFSPNSEQIADVRGVDPDLELKDLLDDKGDLFEISFNISVIIGFSMFIYYFINKKALYITDISVGLKIIGGGKLDHKIEVKGNDEITSLAENINRMSEALMQHIEDERKILQSEQRLITGVSHDLRAPLSSIIGYIYVVKDKQYRTEEEKDKYLEIVLEKSLRLQHLLDDLLEMTKLQETDMNIQTVPVDITDFKTHFLSYVVTELNNNCHNVSEVVVEDSIESTVGYMSLNNMFTFRVLDNIISNIRKYALNNKSVEINVAEKDEFIELEIVNYCDDKTLLHAGKLTERFFKVENSRTAEDGSGLGLNICKGIMEKQEGYLKIRTDLNRKQIITALGFRKYYN